MDLLVILVSRDSTLTHKHMDINVRTVGKYRDVEVRFDDGTLVPLGLLTREECMSLARDLKTAIVYLLETAEYEHLMNEDQ